jgi:predicted HAD superfamily Cof-like phosphohydrolase
MTEQIEQVREFYTAFKQPIGQGVNEERAMLRTNLLDEEVGELHRANINGDYVEALDGIVDCMYILIGTAIELGIDHLIPAAFAEVHRSNMTKLDAKGNPVFRADGKITKSELYEKPNLKKLFV